jgi:nucleotide-binding universal stress UspA family protein
MRAARRPVMIVPRAAPSSGSSAWSNGSAPPPTLTPTRLLIAYDGSEDAAGATRAAGRLMPGAEALVVFARGESVAVDQAALEWFTVPDAVITDSVAEYELVAEKVAREVAEHGRAIAVEAGIDATAAVRVGASVWRVICDAVAEHRADLVVCGSSGHGGFSRAVLGSTSSSLLHHAPVPVMVVPSGAGAHDGPALIGYDGSDGAKDAIRAAAGLLAGRSVLVVHAWTSHVQRSFLGSSLLSAPITELREIAGDLDEYFAAGARDIAEEGAALARDAGLEARALTVAAEPRIWGALTATAAKEEAALIVAGSRGRGAAASTVLGSVSLALAHNADVPVLIIRRTE